MEKGRKEGSNVGLIAKFQILAWWYNSFGVWFGVGKKNRVFYEVFDSQK
jgi:hypothetical protein